MILGDYEKFAMNAKHVFVLEIEVEVILVISATNKLFNKLTLIIIDKYYCL